MRATAAAADSLTMTDPSTRILDAVASAGVLSGTRRTPAADRVVRLIGVRLYKALLSAIEETDPAA